MSNICKAVSIFYNYNEFVVTKHGIFYGHIVCSWMPKLILKEDKVMNIIKGGDTTVEDLTSIIEQCTDYVAEVKAKQITDLESQIKQLQGQLKELKK